MFTGIIEEKGILKSIQRGAKSAQLIISAKDVLEDTKLGDSIATNGVCLTVTDKRGDTFSVDVMHETLAKSSLGDLKPGDALNLERAMRPTDRFGGHIVSGHIDGTGTIRRFEKDDIATWVYIQTPKNLLKYIVDKGSIAIDGISLTVGNVNADGFNVSIIPHTKDVTTLLSKAIWTKVNLECDIIGKYVEKLLTSNDETKLDASFLKKHGF